MSSSGLLVRSWGRAFGPAPSSFTLDDGSGHTARVLLPGGVAAPAPGSFVSVVGISSCEQDADRLLRLLRVRGAADIQTF